MAHVFQTFDTNGKPHPRLKYEYRDWKGRKRKATGTTSKTETQKTADRRQMLENEIRDGIRTAPKASDKARDYPATVAEYLAWGRSCGGRRGFGWSGHHAIKKDFMLLEFWPKRLKLMEIQDIEQNDVVRALCDLQAQGLAGKTVKAYSEGIASFAKWCVLQKYIACDPLPTLSKLAKFDLTPATPHRELSDDEIRALQDATPPYRFLIYRVALQTGYRQNELRKLTVGCLDLFGPSLPLAAEFCKDRRDARQPITRELADELAALSKGKEPDAPLLPIPAKETAGQNFDRDCTKAGFKRTTKDGKATFHSFRVNYINAVVKSGADLKTIMTLARHSSATMSMSTYAKPDAKRMRDVTESVAEALKLSAAAPIALQRVAVGAEGEPINTVMDSVYPTSKMASLRGFEPRLEA